MGKSVLVNYFATFREQRGLASEHCDTDAATLGDFYDELRQKHGFSLRRQSLRVAKNTKFCQWEDGFSSGDEIAFIPPVAGG